MRPGLHIVAKFGGSSVKDASAIKRSAQIVANNPKVGIVVISATQHTTNNLEELCISAALGLEDQVKNIFLKIWDRHKEISKELEVLHLATNLLDKLESEIWLILNSIVKNKKSNDADLDYLYSFGERISSALFSFYLAKIVKNKKVELIPATSLIKTGREFKRANPNIEKISLNCQSLLSQKLQEKNTIFVTQGFIGFSNANEYTTLGREGSDYSAALLGEGSFSSAIEIWTDVPGVFTADPRIIAGAKSIPKLSYKEATTLAKLGAKILFSETLRPAERKNIPVFVASSLNPELGGTWISTEHEDSWPLTGVSLMDEMSYYQFKLKDKAAIDWDALVPLFFKHHKNNVEFYLPKRRAISAELIEDFKKIAEISILANQSILSMVGRAASSAEFKHKLFTYLSSKFAAAAGPQLITGTDFSLSFSWKEVDSLELLRASHDYLIEMNR